MAVGRFVFHSKIPVIRFNPLVNTIRRQVDTKALRSWAWFTKQGTPGEAGVAHL